MMAKVVVPISSVKYDRDQAYPLAVAEVFAELVLEGPDELTYTMRVRVAEVFGHREKARKMLKERLEPEEAERLLKLLDEHDWDVSFFVDTW